MVSRNLSINEKENRKIENYDQYYVCMYTGYGIYGIAGGLLIHFI